MKAIRNGFIAASMCAYFVHVFNTSIATMCLMDRLLNKKIKNLILIYVICNVAQITPCSVIESCHFNQRVKDLNNSCKHATTGTDDG